MKSHPDFPNLFVVDHPLVAHKLSHMRDQDSSTRTFRSLLRELTLLMGYELTRDLPLTTKRIQTPLVEMDAPVIAGKKVAIVGDIKNSRVANSNIELLGRVGVEVILVGPPHFLPQTDLRVHHRIEEVIDEVDVIMSLRAQTERHANQIYASLKDYGTDFCITSKLMGNRDIIILHPGPVHRNVDVDDFMMKDPRSKILEQVKNGVAVRMAVLEKLIEH